MFQQIAKFLHSHHCEESQQVDYLYDLFLVTELGVIPPFWREVRTKRAGLPPFPASLN